MLEVRELSVSRGSRHILDEVTLSARRGEFVVVIGPPGAGKSTLLRALAGRILPTAGRVTLDGRALASVRSEYHASAADPGDARSPHAYADIAKALDRDADVILLDEPSRRLEREHHVHVLRIFHSLAAAGKIVIAALADLDIAAYFADRVVLLDRGKIVANGTPGRILTVERLHDAYGLPCTMLRR